MKLKKIALFQIVLLLLMMAIPSFALTNNSPTLFLDKTSVTTGTNVTASGAAEPGAWVPLKVVDGEKNIVVFDVAKADENGAYSTSFIVPSNASGVLTVVVGEGKQVVTGNVTIVTDITGHWAEAYIKTLIEKGAITGYPDQTFKPNNNITRAEFATIVVKAFNLEAKTGKIFNDIAEHWAKDFVATAQAHGIVNGYSETAFGPDDNITREQMAVMIVKAAKMSEVAEGKSFTDSSKISTWARAAVASASKSEIITGYPDQTFRPQGQATRAEAATVVVKALK